MSLMSTVATSGERSGRILCCRCGQLTDPRLGATCAPCLRARTDITACIGKDATVNFCRFCERYLSPPNHWVACALESRQLMSLCLKRIKNLAEVHLTDANFIWTEPHSKRIKIKLTVQSEIREEVVMQQCCIVDISVHHHMCDECRRAEANDTWTASVQVRQKRESVKTLLYLEQLLIKFDVARLATSVKPMPAGIDFFFATSAQAKKMVDFVSSVLPVRVETSKKLISHDRSSNVYNYKYTSLVTLAPVARDAVLCLPKCVALASGNIGRLCVVVKVTTTAKIVDPLTCQTAELSGSTLFQHGIASLSTGRKLTRFTVIDVEVADRQHQQQHQHQRRSTAVSADVWVVRADELGAGDAIHCKSHLGHLLKPGDTVLGLDVERCNFNNADFDDALAAANVLVPDVIVVKKLYGADGGILPNASRRQRRWKLRHIVNPDELTHAGSGAMKRRDAAADATTAIYDDFLDDLEEDVEMRRYVNVYRDSTFSGVDDNDGEARDGRPTIDLAEMLDELTLNDDDDDDEMNEVA